MTEEKTKRKEFLLEYIKEICLSTIVAEYFSMNTAVLGSEENLKKAVKQFAEYADEDQKNYPLGYMFDLEKYHCFSVTYDPAVNQLYIRLVLPHVGETEQVHPVNAHEVTMEDLLGVFNQTKGEYESFSHFPSISFEQFLANCSDVKVVYATEQVLESLAENLWK